MSEAKELDTLRDALASQLAANERQQTQIDTLLKALQVSSKQHWASYATQIRAENEALRKRCARLDVGSTQKTLVIVQLRKTLAHTEKWRNRYMSRLARLFTLSHPRDT